MRKKCIVPVLFMICMLMGCAGRENQLEMTAVDKLGQEETIEKGMTGKDITEPVVIILTHAAAEGSALDKICIKFKELVELEADGELYVDIYPEGKLGSGLSLQYALDNATIQMSAGSFNCVNVPEFVFFYIPYMISDRNSANQLLDNHNFQEAVGELFAKNNRIPLAILPDDYRVVVTNKPIQSIDDFQGMCFRIPDKTMASEYWGALGMQMQEINFSNLNAALQQGKIDAFENSLSTIVSYHLYNDEQKYVLETNHVMQFHVLGIHKEYFEQLSERHQNILLGVIPKLEKYAEEVSVEERMRSIEILEKEGVQILTLPEEEINRLKEISMQQIALRFFEECDSDWLDVIKNTLEME